MTIIAIEPVLYITRIPVMTYTSNIGTTKKNVGESGREYVYSTSTILSIMTASIYSTATTLTTRT